MGTQTTNTKPSTTPSAGTVIYSAWGSGWMAEQMGCPHEPPMELFGKPTTKEQRAEWSRGWHYSKNPPVDKELNVWGKELAR